MISEAEKIHPRSQLNSGQRTGPHRVADCGKSIIEKERFLHCSGVGNTWPTHCLQGTECRRSHPQCQENSHKAKSCPKELIAFLDELPLEAAPGVERVRLGRVQKESVYREAIGQFRGSDAFAA